MTSDGRDRRERMLISYAQNDEDVVLHRLFG
jgi:hypothetical protein